MVRDHWFKQTRSGRLCSQIEATFKQLDTAGTELECFQSLQKQEQLAAAYRVNGLVEEVNRQMELERKLQRRYSDLLTEHERTQKLLEEHRIRLQMEEEIEARNRALEEEIAAKNRALEEETAGEKQIREEEMPVEDRASDILKGEEGPDISASGEVVHVVASSEEQEAVVKEEVKPEHGEVGDGWPGSGAEKGQNSEAEISAGDQGQTAPLSSLEESAGPVPESEREGGPFGPEETMDMDDGVSPAAAVEAHQQGSGGAKPADLVDDDRAGGVEEGVGSVSGAGS